MTMTAADPRLPDPADAGDLLAQAPAARRPALGGGLALWMGLCLALVAAVALAVGAWVVERRYEQAVAETRQRVEVRAEGKAEVLSAWLAGLAQLSGQLVDNDQIRLFATEADMARPDDPLYGQTSPLGPYMTNGLTEFVGRNPVAAAYLAGRDGEPVLASAGAAEPTPAQQALAALAVATADTALSPLRRVPGGVAFDMSRPILAVQGADPFVAPDPVGAVLVTVPAQDRLAALLQPGELAVPGERTVLLELGEDGDAAAWHLTVGGLAAESVSAEPDAGPAGGHLAFAERPSPATGGPVFSAGATVPGTPWRIVQELDREAALAPVGRTRLLAVLVGGLAALAIAGSFAAVWYRLQGSHHRAMAAQYRDMAGRIDAHRRLLSGITETVGELIGLKRRDGSYAYVNRALAAAVGREPGTTVGMTDETLFGYGTAERLAQADRAAWAGQRQPPAEEVRYLAGRARHLETTRVPLARQDGAIDGIVAVSRDVTDLVEARRKREAAIAQTVEALVRTVELSDPYLAGHSRLLREVAGMVARRLELAPSDVTAVEIAATLSQIGKPRVPRDILTKPERLTPQEIEVMQTHIVHAVRVIADIDFTVPVAETVAQLYERLDGSGYPNALVGDAIHRRARILGVCDWFCARIRPRGYRSAIPAAEALRVLSEHPGKYDPAVVDALQRALATPDGEKLLAAGRAA